MIERPSVNPKIFVDSNVLIYAHDLDEPHKRTIALRIFEDLWLSKAGILSMQVLQEFYSIATRKIRSPLPKPVAREAIEHLAVW